MNEVTGIPWEGIFTCGVIDQNDFDELMLHDTSISIPWKRKIVSTNKVTNYARSYLAQVLVNSVTYPLITPSAMQMGTGTGVPASTDVALWSATPATLKSCSTVQTYQNFYSQFITVWQSTDPIQGTWTEAGLFDVSGNLWAHVNTNATVNAGEVFVAQWQVQFITN